VLLLAVVPLTPLLLTMVLLVGGGACCCCWTGLNMCATAAAPCATPDEKIEECEQEIVCQHQIMRFDVDKYRACKM